MKVKNISLFLLFFFVCGTGCDAQKVISKPLPNNPTSYIFKIKIADARFVLEKSLNKYGSLNLHIHDIYYQSTSKPLRWWPETAKKALAGEENKADVYMQVSVDSSAIYFDKKAKPFGYEMECVAHFTKIDSNTTKMEIRVLTAKVHLRDRLLPSPPHFVNNPVYKTVIPTTIEEYKILQCLGRALGVFNQMPVLKILAG
jgi:hypothetical protein